jgi:hypothetical protein
MQTGSGDQAKANNFYTQALGAACQRLEYLNLGNIDIGAVIHIFIASVAKAFPATVKTDVGPVLVAASRLLHEDAEGNSSKRQGTSSSCSCIVTIEETMCIEPSLLQPLCATLKTLVLSLRYRYQLSALLGIRIRKDPKLLQDPDP